MTETSIMCLQHEYIHQPSWQDRRCWLFWLNLMTSNISTRYTFRVSWEIKFINFPNIHEWIRNYPAERRSLCYQYKYKGDMFKKELSGVLLCKLKLSEIPKKPSRHDGLNKQMYCQCVKVLKSSHSQRGSKLAEVQKVQNTYTKKKAYPPWPWS